ncbi:NADP-dependent oxidoreductase [Nesterenkonia haasae]|uniref:NADP-dependent oxidoreductase n=1 Tax=Nesterenkonia haasae TaxID=2587813 RepID=UPI0013919AAB|nr:NADP-dependent oxidoreductase [Nesterenkonia haasae]NDK32774.1 NADP-dependent oxidoreductase [Nesterenkonia haasae]
MTPESLTSLEVRLRSRPNGDPVVANFEFAEVDLPSLSPGQILVRNTWMSVDPYMRGRMDDVESYIPPFALGKPLEGSALGEVIASEAPSFPVGTTVNHFAGWRTHAVLDAAEVTSVDTALASPEDHLGVLGTTGLTAYASLTEIAPVRAGDIVFISAAAGAVGSVAGQLASLLGATRVIGSAGGTEKARRVVEDFGFDAAIDYKAGSVAEQLAEAAPDGIDVYLDMVGAEHLEAAIGAMRTGGRIALVGAISGYNAIDAPKGPSNLYNAIAKRLTLRGMIVTDHLHRFSEYVPKAAAWVADGSLRTETTVVNGLENAPEAFLSLFRGANTGKLLVRLH